MTNNPYDDYLDPAHTPDQPGPQPVTEPENPFLAHQQPGYGLAEQGQAHPHPFTQEYHPPAPYYNAPPPETQRHMRNLQLNVWLSAFFPIVSVLFFFVDKGKAPLYDDHLREALNMGLTRLILAGGALFLSSWFSTLFSVVAFVYLFLAVVGAVEAPKRYEAGEKYQYLGAIPFTRQ